MDLYYLSSVTKLQITNTSIYGGIPPAMGDMMNLRVLDLSHNCLTNALPLQLSRLSHLMDIDLRSNLFTGMPSQQNLYENASII